MSTSAGEVEKCRNLQKQRAMVKLFFTFDLVDDGAVELGVGSGQVLQIPVVMRWDFGFSRQPLISGMNEKNEEKRNLRIGSCCRGDDRKTNVVKSQKNSCPKYCVLERERKNIFFFFTFSFLAKEFIWLTWGLLSAHLHSAHSQSPVRSPPCPVAGIARTLKFPLSKHPLKKNSGWLQPPVSWVVNKDPPRLIGSSSGGAWESSSRSWQSEKEFRSREK